MRRNLNRRVMAAILEMHYSRLSYTDSCVIPKLGVLTSRARDLARIALTLRETCFPPFVRSAHGKPLHARSLVPLVKARDFGMTPKWMAEAARRDFWNVQLFDKAQSAFRSPHC